jgi:hypothetical protein
MTTTTLPPQPIQLRFKEFDKKNLQRILTFLPKVNKTKAFDEAFDKPIKN